MANSTLLNFENVMTTNQDPLMLLIFLIIWGFPLLIYLLVGIGRKARTSNGKVIQGTRMIQTLNFWIVFSIWFIVQATLFILLLIYPFWLKLI